MRNEQRLEAVNTFSGGMNLDTDISLLKNNQYRYAEEMRLDSNESSSFGSISPIENHRIIDLSTFSWGDVVATAYVRDMSVVFVSGSPASKIYLVKEDDNGDLDISVIANILYKFPKKISVVTRYEDHDNIKVYWADGIGQIKSLNILDGKSTISTPDEYNIIQGIEISSPVIVGFRSGSLKYGRYQYYYQLYNKNGSSSNMSAGSQLVTVADSGVNTISEYGDGLMSNKSIQIKISTNGVDYYGIKIYRVYYHKYGSTPRIEVIFDSMGERRSGNFPYNDHGGQPLDELSIDQFASISSNYIHPKYIESKDNILFAANTKEDSFDIDYDARSIQFDSSGKAKLYSSDLVSFIIIHTSELDDGAMFKALSRHDFIHKEIYEKAKYSDLHEIYNKSGNFGGSGPNVDFYFENTYLIGAGTGSRVNSVTGRYDNDPRSKYIDDRIPRIGASEESIISDIYISQSDSDQMRKVPVDNFGISPHDGKLDYSNGLISAALAGYKRDEIYRFGVVLHGKNGRSSSVKWIADIRFPANYVSDSNWDASSFESPENSVKEFSDRLYVSDQRSWLENQELLVKPLGIKFVLRNLPSEVDSVTIVRSKRSINDRTILAQGALKKFGKTATNMSNDYYYLSGLGGVAVPHPLLSSSTASTLMVLSNKMANPGVDEEYRVIPAPDFGQPDDPDKRTNQPMEDPYGRMYSVIGFVSPESSFNYDGFGSAITSFGTGAKLIMQDIIYPKTTPSIIPGRSGSAGATDGVVVGSSEHRYLRDLTDRENKTTYIYSAADLTEDLASMSTELDPSRSSFFPMGLAARTWLTTTRAPGSPVGGGNMNIGAYDGSQTWANNFTEPFLRVSVATRAIGEFDPVSNPTKWKDTVTSGIWRSISKKSVPIAFYAESDAAARFVRAGAGSMSFKYYFNYNTKTGDYSNLRLRVFRYPSDNLRDGLDYYIDGAGELPEIDIDKMVQLIDIDRGVSALGAPRSLIQPHAPLINHTMPASSDSYSSAWNGGSSIIAHPFGRHGSIVAISMKNPENMAWLDATGKYKRKYTTSRKYPFEYYEGAMEQFDMDVSSGLSTYISDIKRMSVGIYGGPGIQSRELTEYIFAGFSPNVFGNTCDIDVFSGDTYVSMFDYTMVRASDPMLTAYAEVTNDRDKEKDIDLMVYHSLQRVGAIIPIESSINTMNNSGKTYEDDINNFMIDKDFGVNSIAISSGEVQTMTFVQSRDEFSYNSAFSTEPTAKPYFQHMFELEKNKVFDCRIYASQVKTNDERFDSWTVFKVADYLDVDTKHGEITRLASHADRLFFWQENAFGIASTTERALIAEGQGHELSLGTGRILGRYDYISTDIGLDKDTILGVHVSNNGVYWVNKKNNIIVRFSDKLDKISMSKFVQTALNYSSDIIGNTFPIVENRKYSDIMFSFDELRNVANIK